MYPVSFENKRCPYGNKKDFFFNYYYVLLPASTWTTLSYSTSITELRIRIREFCSDTDQDLDPVIEMRSDPVSKYGWIRSEHQDLNSFIVLFL